MRKSLKKLKNGSLMSSRFSRTNLIIFTLVFVSIGTYLIFHSFAAGFAASAEPENGTVASPARVISDSSASGGSAVKFQTAGSCPVSTSNVPDGPDPWGGCWPGPATTGVPVGTTLTPSGTINVTTAGAVINGRVVTGNIIVNAPNVTIKNTRIYSSDFRAIENNSTGLMVEDSEVISQVGTYECHNGIGHDGFTIRRSEVYGCENAVSLESNAIVEDNYFHDLDTNGPSYVWGNEPHTDGIQGVTSNTTIRHNWIDPSPGGGVTSAIIMNTNGAGQNVRIENNYLDGRGASYAIYLNRQASTSIFINSNRMYKGYGYTACAKLGNTVTEFNDNRDAGTNVLLTPDNGFDGGCTN